MVVEQLKQRYRYEVSSFSKKGRRDSNDDAIAVVESDTRLTAVLADGMGGYSNGEGIGRFVSSALTSEILQAEDPATRWIDDLFNQLNDRVNQLFLEGGATVGGIIIQGDQLIIFWCGDVRVYCFNGDTKIVTKDHTVLNEMIRNNVFVKATEIKRLANLVTRSISVGSGNATPEIMSLPIATSCDIFICSDGVHQTASSVIESKTEREDSVSYLKRIENACEAHSFDNFSGILIEIRKMEV